MRSPRRIFAFMSFPMLILLLTANLPAVPDNSACNGGGGCSTPCKASGEGSSLLIAASQLPECSPMAMSSCPGNGQAICGVQYTFSSDNCDPATITSSHYSYSGTCSQ
jgi:hypothetical protein